MTKPLPPSTGAGEVCREDEAEDASGATFREEPTKARATTAMPAMATASANTAARVRLG